ncbi:MAG: 1-acyl-sn-glycerol-3-phosphate acyltransferase [Acidobacteriota bacterium]|nr:1-acyl-sn-glycerol-3-phosphate acyltransferase [Acidobacteriota bacterium]
MIAIVIVTMAHYGFLLATCLALRVVGRPTLPWRMRLFRSWSRTLSSIMGMRLAVEGAPPAPPFVLVANHVGYVDVLALSALVPGIFIAKAEIGGWPFIGAICRSVNTVFIDRRRIRDISRVLDDVNAMLHAGYGIVMFPEGRTSDGAAVHPFRSPLLEVAARVGKGVHHATLTYATPDGAPPARDVVSWHGGKNLVVHLYRLLTLPGFEARISFGEEGVRGDDRKELARRLHAAVSGSFTPLATDREAVG